MQTTAARSFFFVWIAALATPAMTAQQAVEQQAAPVFEDGMAQKVKAFRNPSEWVRHWLFVETDFDTDGDGKKDRMHVDVTRPKQTETEGLKVPVVYETSPYFSGIGSSAQQYFWNVEHELGAVPPKRAEMPEIRFVAKPGMIMSLRSDREAQTWVPRGFAVVHSCSPGTGWSQGCPTIGGDNESFAPKAVIDWLCGRAKGYTTIDGNEEVEASWCTGKVGMIGTSYNGTLPLAAATTGVEGLEAIVPIAPNTSYYHYYRSNGLVRSPGGYLGEDVDVLFDFIHSGHPDRRAYCNEKVRDELLAANADRLTGDYNEFWAGRDYLNDLGPMRAATLMAHAFNDWNVMPEHSVRIYAALKQKGVPCMAYFHQNGHGGQPPHELVNKWFTRFLYGVDNGIEKDPKAWIVREGDRPSNPTSYADYPNPAAKPVVLRPSGDGGAIGALQIGEDRAGNGRQKLIDDVAMSAKDLALAEQSSHRLLFATEELKSPVHISGTARLKIRVASSKPACNLSIMLVSLPWERTRRITDNIITRGWADPQNHRSLTESEPLKPGTFYDLEFDLQPDDQVIRKGQRIGLMIFSSDQEHTLHPAPGTELVVDLAGTALTLPVVGGAAALRAATSR
ncbi:MAG: Xaa-Pro dipeptidyl-peptidase [Planctomycetes bacterium]|nr:Xaa-Pro dipeptidyl-peptidase [Planctomycetota bacterium]